MIQADARHIPLKDESVQCVVTSPPYWGLRDYGIAPSVWGAGKQCPKRADGVHLWRRDNPSSQRQRNGAEGGLHEGREINKLADGIMLNPEQGATCETCHAWRGVLGLEPTPELYVQHMVEVFREVRRVLRKDGTVWMNLGDSYAASQYGSGGGWAKEPAIDGIMRNNRSLMNPVKLNHGLKPKDLCGIPWRVAFALQADGWWLRSDIIWSKPNPMPESVTDRPTKAHEYIFLLAKSADYFYDAEAIREPHAEPWRGNRACNDPSCARTTSPSMDCDCICHGTIKREGSSEANRVSCGLGGSTRVRNGTMGNDPTGTARFYNPAGRNKRTVWTVATQPYPEAHFATFPEDLIKPCIMAGTSQRGACSECGAPWERVVERNGVSRETNLKINTAKAMMGVNEAHRLNGKDYIHATGKTLGWQSTCHCQGWHSGGPDFYPKDTRPCIVLDPFAGSGTTVKVSQDLGRIGIGLDLKPEYLKMAKRRAAQGGLMA